MFKKLVLLSILQCLSPLFSVTVNVGWNSPQVISTVNAQASDPRTGIDANGNVVGIWIENGSVVTRNLPYNSSWSNPTVFSGPGLSNPRIVVDNAGNATAIWINTNTNTMYTASQTNLNNANPTWGGATPISSSGASAPRLAVDDTGNVVAVWVRNNAVEAATRLFNGSWQSPVVISGAGTAASPGAQSPQVSIGDNGHVSAVWHAVPTSTGISTVFTASKLISSTNWSGETLVSDGTYNTAYPKVAVDTNGNTTVGWFRYVLNNSIYSKVIVEALDQPFNGSWSSPVQISEPGIMNPASLVLKIRNDVDGNSVASWINSFDGATFNCQAATKPMGKAWNNAVSISGNNLGAYSFDLAADDLGHVFTVYMGLQNSSYNIIASKMDIYAEAQGWGPKSTISTGTNNGFPVSLASFQSGNMYTSAVWLQYNDAGPGSPYNQVVAATGSGPAFQTPTINPVNQLSNNVGIFTEYYNVVTWNALPGAVFYLLYRNDVLIAKLPAGTLSYTDHNQPYNQSVTYTIAATDGAGSQSPDASVTWP